mmetsp:Transcript_24056/g.35580  ORF Transcript_24056/g.35580 Transcript_24056/m.35580 type:complete len:113 (-) Transcript_24056:1156-1494(-)
MNHMNLIEWIKDCEEISSYCLESDDIKEEVNEAMRNQGNVLSYSCRFHLAGMMFVAINPEDLDIKDKSNPFTKVTLDNLFGIEHEQSCCHCFTSFEESTSLKGLSKGPMKSF